MGHKNGTGSKMRELARKFSFTVIDFSTACRKLAILLLAKY